METAFERMCQQCASNYASEQRPSRESLYLIDIWTRRADREVRPSNAKLEVDQWSVNFPFPFSIAPFLRIKYLWNSLLMPWKREMNHDRRIGVKRKCDRSSVPPSNFFRSWVGKPWYAEDSAKCSVDQQITIHCAETRWSLHLSAWCAPFDIETTTGTKKYLLRSMGTFCSKS